MNHVKPIPIFPLALMSTIQVIDQETPAPQAQAWMAQIEGYYNAYYGNPDPVWTWDDTHTLDRDILVELEEVIRAAHTPPLDQNLVCSFLTPEWRRPYQTMAPGRFEKIYFSSTKVWVGECQCDATHEAPLPEVTDTRWIVGTPNLLDIPVLTLSRFFPNQRFGVTVETKLSQPVGRYPNHPPFAGAVAWMNTDAIRSHAVPCNS